MIKTLVFLLPLLLISSILFAEEIIYSEHNSGKLHIKVFNNVESFLASTVELVDSSGHAIWGLDVLGNPFDYPGESRLWISGDTVLSITPDVYEYTISRPYRFETVSGTVDIQEGQTTQINIQLKPIVDMPNHGWYVGDAHQHIVHGEKHFAVNVEKAAAIAKAEGADWSSFCGYWSSVPDDHPSIDEMRKRCQLLSDQNYLALVGEEYPKDHLGHMACMPGNITDWKEDIGINSYEHNPDTKYNLAHFEILRMLFQAEGISIYTHPIREYGGTRFSPGNIGRELPFDLLVSPQYIPIVDWMTDNPLDEDSFNLWSMYLNWGYSIGICAFSDTCYDRNDARPMFRRTYVYLGDQAPSSETIIDALKNQRSFGTYGPLMLTSVDGEVPGTEFKANGTERTLTIDAYAPGMDYFDRQSKPVLDRIEIIRNGTIFKTVSLKDQNITHYQHQAQLKDTETSWYVIKVYSSGNYQVAVSSPFYFRDNNFTPPTSAQAKVTGKVTDAKSDDPLQAKLEFFHYPNDSSEILETYSVSNGEFDFTCSPTYRIRATADGYKPLVKSIFMDDPNLYRNLIYPLQRTHMLDKDYYQNIKAALQNIQLDFELERMN